MPQYKGRKKIGEILIAMGRVSEMAIHNILQEQQKTKAEKGYQIRIGDLLLKKKLISEHDLAEAVAVQYNTDYVDLRGVQVAPELLERVPLNLLADYNFVPIKLEPKRLTIASEDDIPEELFGKLFSLFRVEIRFVSATRFQIAQAKAACIEAIQSIEGSGKRDILSLSSVLGAAPSASGAPLSGGDDTPALKEPPFAGAQAAPPQGLGGGLPDTPLVPHQGSPGLPPQQPASSPPPAFDLSAASPAFQAGSSTEEQPTSGRPGVQLAPPPLEAHSQDLPTEGGAAWSTAQPGPAQDLSGPVFTPDGTPAFQPPPASHPPQPPAQPAAPAGNLVSDGLQFESGDALAGFTPPPVSSAPPEPETVAPGRPVQETWEPPVSEPLPPPAAQPAAQPEYPQPTSQPPPQPPLAAQPAAQPSLDQSFPETPLAQPSPPALQQPPPSQPQYPPPPAQPAPQPPQYQQPPAQPSQPSQPAPQQPPPQQPQYQQPPAQPAPQQPPPQQPQYQQPPAQPAPQQPPPQQPQYQQPPAQPAPQQAQPSAPPQPAPAARHPAAFDPLADAPPGLTGDIPPRNQPSGRLDPDRLPAELTESLLWATQESWTTLTFLPDGGKAQIVGRRGTRQAVLADLDGPTYGRLIQTLSQLLEFDPSNLSHPVRRVFECQLRPEEEVGNFAFTVTPSRPPLVQVILKTEPWTRGLGAIGYPPGVPKPGPLLASGQGLVILAAPDMEAVRPVYEATLAEAGFSDAVGLALERKPGGRVPGVLRIQAGIDKKTDCPALSPSALADFVEGGNRLLSVDQEPSPRDLKRLVHLALTETAVLVPTTANDALNAFMRVKSCGVSTSALVEATRLILVAHPVGRICPYCKETYLVTEDMLPEEQRKALSNIKVYRGKGCGGCEGSGIQGITYLFETLELPPGRVDVDRLTREKMPLRNFLLEEELLIPLQKHSRKALMWGLVGIEDYLARCKKS